MKANEAPEKLYMNWVNYPLEEMQVEYTRTDVFIEKACEWLKENGGSYWMDDYDLPTDDLVNDFKKYMEGE